MIWMEGRPPPRAHDCEINIKFHIPRAAPTILLQGGAVCLFTVKDIAPSAFTIFPAPFWYFTISRHLDGAEEYSSPNHHQTRKNWTISGNKNLRIWIMRYFLIKYWFVALQLSLCLILICPLGIHLSVCCRFVCRSPLNRVCSSISESVEMSSNKKWHQRDDDY